MPLTIRTLSLTCTLIASLVAGTDARAQQPAAGYTGFLAAGVSSIASGALSERLVASGYPDFSRTPFGIAIGGYKRLASGLLVGGEWHYLAMGDGTHEGRDVGLGGGNATLGVGYMLDLASRVRAYPRLGLGLAGMGLWSEDTDGTAAVTLDEWLAAPHADPDYSTLSQASMALDIGAGAELALRTAATGPIIGLRFGYVATPFDQGWTRDGARVTGAPDATVAGPYLRVMIGWRGERR